MFSVYGIYFNTKDVFFKILSAINQYQKENNNILKKICFSKVKNLDISKGNNYIVFFSLYESHEKCYNFFTNKNMEIITMDINLINHLDFQENWYIPFKSNNFKEFNLEDYTEFKKFLF
jgi:hypothetical protein